MGMLLRRFSLFVLLLQFSTPPAYASTLPQFCANHLKTKVNLGFDVRSLEKKINAKIGENAHYKAVLSSDLDFLRNEVKVDGPGAQRNMRIDSPKNQFRFNSESKAIFEMKKRMLSRYPEKVIGFMPKYEKDIRAAVREQFAMMLEEFPVDKSDIFRREGDTLINLLTGDRLSTRELAKMDGREGLQSLGLFVPDDLLFMKKVGEEYLLIGGNLASPTRWSIDSALGESITQIHALIAPTSQASAAFSTMINKILDRTLGTRDIPCRNNWFIETDPRYSIPGYMTVDYAAPSNITQKNYLSNVFVRTERQSLRGLPKSKTVLFGIQPFVFPLASVMDDRNLAETVLERIKTKFQPGANRDDFAMRIAKYLEKDLGSNPNRFETKALGVTRVNEMTYMLTVDRPTGVDLVPGEAVRVTLTTPTGKETRTLSLASSPNLGTLQFAVKESDSAFKQTFKSITAGTPVQLEFLRTSLEFKTDKPMVMIAGGIGITPFRSILQHVEEKKLPTPMWLLYGNRDQIAFADELTEAAKNNSRLNVRNVLSRPTDEAWTGTRGRIDKNYLHDFVSTVAPADAHYYVVATPQMSEDVRTALIASGIREDRISIEAFPGYGATKENVAIDPKKTKDCETVCYCHRVTAGQIRDAVKAGANSLEALRTQTKAATGCGGCLSNIMKLLQCELEIVR